jgi:hypothetical protein
MPPSTDPTEAPFAGPSAASEGGDPRVDSVRERFADAYLPDGHPPHRVGGEKACRPTDKLYVRDRIACCSTTGPSSRTACYANAARHRSAGRRRRHRRRAPVDGRPAIVIANDPTVKAGSWGARTVEKIVRMTEYRAARRACRSSGSSTRPGPASPTRSRCSPVAAAPGGSSTTRCALSGKVPQICCLFGPSPPAGPTSRASATSSSWSRATPRCTSAAPAWPRWSSVRRPPSRRPAAPGCTAPCRACGDNLAHDDAGRHRAGQGLLHLRAGSTGATTRRPTRPTSPGPAAHAAIVPERESHGLRHPPSSTASSTPRASSRSSRCSRPSWSSGSV